MTFNKERNEFFKIDGKLTAGDLHKKIWEAAKNRGCTKDAFAIIDYVISPGDGKDRVLQRETLLDYEFICYVSPGANEGTFLDCLLVRNGDCIRVSSAKTLSEDTAAYSLLGGLGGVLTKFGYEFLCVNCD